MIRGSATLTRLSHRQTALSASRQIHSTSSKQFWPFRRSPSKATATSSTLDSAPAVPLLGQNDLFQPLSQSPFPALVDKANRIKNVSLCPTSLEKHDERIRPAYDCPDCGWPTHASQARWVEGKEEHQEYCARLREVNEDEHDIRSGRMMSEFENLPGM
jgi:splicing suppressor protein 51